MDLAVAGDPGRRRGYAEILEEKRAMAFSQVFLASSGAIKTPIIRFIRGARVPRNDAVDRRGPM